MMKTGKLESKDLMIGDFVRHFNGSVMKVTATKGNQYACGFPFCWSYNNDYYPITLTREILEKNGWWYDEIDNVWYSTVHAPVLLGRNCESLSMFDGRVVVGTVHILQHALRLCGMEELADDFQV